MNEYEKLISEYELEGLTIIEKNFSSNAKGLIKGDKIGISSKIDTMIEKRCILAEELGHYYTNVGNILDLSILENRKQEYKAMKWSYEKLVKLDDIIRAHKANCSNKFELAEFLNITVEFLEESVDYYRKLYGVFVNYDDIYTIIFEPSLSVIKRF